jgi:hypothetical protein
MRRRDLLFAAGGSFVGLPWLESLPFPTARAQGVDLFTPAGFPKRLLICFKGNGVYPDNWFPIPGTGPTDFELNVATAPLEPVKSHLTFLDGIDNRVITDQGPTPGEDHNKGAGSILTGWELNEGDFIGADNTSRGGYGKGPSIDQVIARHIGNDSPILSLQVGFATHIGNELSRPINYEGNLKPLQSQHDPKVVFDQVFRDRALPEDQAKLLRERRVDVMTFTSERYQRLSQSVSQADQQRLAEHATLMSELQTRLATAAAVACLPPDAPAEMNADDQGNGEQIVSLQRDMVLRAFACGLTRVATLMIGNGANDLFFPFMDAHGNDHLVGHDEQSNIDDAVTRRLPRHLWHMEQLRDTILGLATTSEGEGSLLDSTLVLFLSENSNGWHQHTRHPLILAGSLGGHFPTGRLLQYAGDSHTRLLISVLNAFGVEGADFGNPAFNDGPLTGLV